MGPWEEGRQCVGACVAWCVLGHEYAASMSVRVIYHKQFKKRKPSRFCFSGLVMVLQCSLSQKSCPEVNINNYQILHKLSPLNTKP
jgi:hypothetical protein